MGILDGIVEWIAEQVMYGLDLINTSVLGALGCDMSTFLRYFPAAETMYHIFVALAIGMGLQNFPEGAAISLPLKSQGTGNGKAFVCGALSGVVEPVFGLLTVLAAGSIGGVMPWILSFAAGAMIYVVVEELIPEAHLGEHSHVGTVSVMAGFLCMMLLDVLLGA